MARARNIKPAIMDNEQLAELSAMERLLFIYLWMLADRDGRIEDRPKRIEKQALPYDEDIDVDSMLSRLHEKGFIVRYTYEGKGFIQIVNFAKHQRPHSTEKDGQFPDENGFLTVQERNEKGYATGNARLVHCSETVKPQLDNGALTVKERSDNALNHDSLIHDSNTPLPPKGGKARVSKPLTQEMADGFERFYAAYPRKVGRKEALKAWLKIAPDSAQIAAIMAGLSAQLPHMDRREKGRFIKHPATWLNGEHWTDEVQGGRTLQLRAPAPADGGPTWWQKAGFEHPAEAQNARCHVGNAHLFRDGRLIEEATA